MFVPLDVGTNDYKVLPSIQAEDLNFFCSRENPDHFTLPKRSAGTASAWPSHAFR